MCGKCESCVAKASMGGGMLSLIVAVVTKLAHCTIMGVGPKSFAAAAALLLLLTIAANTYKHPESHE